MVPQDVEKARRDGADGILRMLPLPANEETAQAAY